MSGPIYTIRFPYKHPDEHVRGSGVLKRFTEVPDGALFMMLDYPGRIHEKLGDSDAACLVPWEGDTGMVLGNPMCELVEEVT